MKKKKLSEKYEQNLAIDNPLPTLDHLIISVNNGVDNNGRGLEGGFNGSDNVKGGDTTSNLGDGTASGLGNEVVSRVGSRVDSVVGDVSSGLVGGAAISVGVGDAGVIGNGVYVAINSDNCPKKETSGSGAVAAGDISSMPPPLIAEPRNNIASPEFRRQVMKSKF